ncbi:uncharacterized protein V1510DRAFT_410819 [Dipodascopsis tothii]|uniref:uncharacterized protein n=1 Tax=Dipodascopsis tothii TaxID=44089 RepID=UPI0034CFF6A0
MAPPLVGLVLWMFVPSMATSTVLNAYYRVFPAAAAPPQSRKHARDRKAVYIAIVLGYLVYTVVAALHDVVSAGNFYRAFGASTQTDDRALRSTYRRLAALHHPDKSGGAGDAEYIAIKRVYDTLSSPVARFAYDRFGPAVLDWQGCKTAMDYVTRGIYVSAPHYLGSLVVLTALVVFRQREYGAYWRFYALFAQAVFELVLVTGGAAQPLLAGLPYPFTVHEIVAVSRKVVIALTIAGAQIGPLLFPRPLEPTSELAAEQQRFMEAMLGRLDAMTVTVNAEASRTFLSELQPFLVDVPPPFDRVVGEVALADRLRAWMVEQRVRGHPRVREAVQDAMAKRHGSVAFRRPRPEPKDRADKAE